MIQKKQYWFNGAWYNEEDALKIIDSPKVIDILFHDYEKRMKKLPKAKFGVDPNISEENYQLLLKTIIGRGHLIINKIYKVYDTIESYYKLQGILKGIEAINKDDFMFVDKNIERLNKIYPMIPIDKYQTVLRYYSKFNIPCNDNEYKHLDDAIREEADYNLYEYVYCLSALYKTKYYIDDVDNLPLMEDEISTKTKEIYDKLNHMVNTKYIAYEDKCILNDIIYLYRVIISISKKIRFIEERIENISCSNKEQVIINELKRNVEKSKKLIKKHYEKLIKSCNELILIVDPTTIDKLKKCLTEDIFTNLNQRNAKK